MRLKGSQDLSRRTMPAYKPPLHPAPDARHPSHALMALMIGAMMIQGITPGPRCRHRAAATVLGRHRLDVDQQRHADRPQPAFGRIVGQPAARALHGAVPGNRWRSRRSASSPSTMRASTSTFSPSRGARRLPAPLSWTASPRPSYSASCWRDLLEEHFRRALVFSNGDPMIFLTHPISLTLLIVAALDRGRDGACPRS